MLTKPFRTPAHRLFCKVLHTALAAVFMLSMIVGSTTPLGAQYISTLPKPGEMVLLSPKFGPVVLKGLTIHPENPLEFDFLVDHGETKQTDEEFKQETQKLIKYFLAAMTIPENESWVNLSPYEGDRIIPDLLASTEMGKQMLEQDYLLKQLASSLTNPEKELGKKFWDSVYKRAFDLYGTTEIPVNTFNKVWIMPQKAVILEQDGYAFIGSSRLKVMMAEDFEAMQKNTVIASKASPSGTSEAKQSLPPNEIASSPAAPRNDITSLSSQIFRETILPEIEKEVNEGKNFAPVRQIYNSVILAAWYKKNLKETLLGKVYADKGKIKGVDIPEKDVKQKVYDQYLDAFRRGVYNLVKEDYDSSLQEPLPRKYFSGGVKFGKAASSALETIRLDIKTLSSAQITAISMFLQGLLAEKRKSGKKLDRDTLERILSEKLNGESRSFAQAVADAIIDSGALDRVTALFTENKGEYAITAGKDFIFSAQTPEKVLIRIEQAITTYSDTILNDGSRSYSYFLAIEPFRMNGDLKNLARELAALPPKNRIFGTDVAREAILKPSSDMTQKSLRIIIEILTSRQNGRIQKPSERYLELLETAAQNGQAQRGTPEQWPGSITEISRNNAGEENGFLTRFWDPEKNTSVIFFQSATGEIQENMIAGNITANPFLLSAFDGDAQKLLKWLDEKVVETTDLFNGQKGLYITILAAAWQSVKEFSRYETDPIINRLIIQIKTLNSTAGDELTTQMARAQTPQERQKIFNETLSQIMRELSRTRPVESTKIFETLLQLATGIIDLKEKRDVNIQIAYDAATNTSTINNVIVNGDWSNTTLFDTIATSAEIISRLSNVAKITSLTPQQQANLFQILTKATTLEENSFRLNTNKRYDPRVEMILAEASSIEARKTAQWILRAANNTPKERKESFINFLATIPSSTNADNFFTETAKLLDLNLQPLAPVASSTIIDRLDGTIEFTSNKGNSDETLITISPTVSKGLGGFESTTQSFKTADIQSIISKIPDDMSAQTFKNLISIAKNKSPSTKEQGALLNVLVTIHGLDTAEFAGRYSSKVNEILALFGQVLYTTKLTSENDAKEAFIKVAEERLRKNTDDIDALERILEINTVSIKNLKSGEIKIFYSARTDTSIFTITYPAYQTKMGSTIPQRINVSHLHTLNGNWQNYSFDAFNDAEGFEKSVRVVATQGPNLTSLQQYNFLRIFDKATGISFTTPDNNRIYYQILNQIDSSTPDNAMFLTSMKADITPQQKSQFFLELLPAMLIANPAKITPVAKILGVALESNLTVAKATAASSTVGGIDFNPALLDLQIKRDSRGVPLPLPMQNIDQINIEGLYPVILNIQPAKIENLPFLMSTPPKPGPDKLSLAK